MLLTKAEAELLAMAAFIPPLSLAKIMAAIIRKMILLIWDEFEGFPWNFFIFLSIFLLLLSTRATGHKLEMTNRAGQSNSFSPAYLVGHVDRVCEKFDPSRLEQ